MRDYLIFCMVWYCAMIWAACAFLFMKNRKRDKERFGCLWLPVIVLVAIFSPGIFLFEIVKTILAKLGILLLFILCLSRRTKDEPAPKQTKR